MRPLPILEETFLKPLIRALTLDQKFTLIKVDETDIVDIHKHTAESGLPGFHLKNVNVKGFWRTEFSSNNLDTLHVITDRIRCCRFSST